MSNDSRFDELKNKYPQILALADALDADLRKELERIIEEQSRRDAARLQK